jgi:modulator of FtsH protease HflC
MKNITKILPIGIFVIIAIFFSGMIYVVSETELVVITQFGKPVGMPIADAGLHFKLPAFIQKAHFFDKRLLEWDGDPNQIPTRDKKYVWIDTTARWKIKDALKFLQSVGTERRAQARLDDIINSATRDIVTGSVLVEVIRDSNRILDQPTVDKVKGFTDEALEKIEYGREGLEEKIFTRAKKLAPQYGIELVDVRIKHVNYVNDVLQKVYERMIAERKRAAEEYRSEGRGKSAEIKGQMEKELKSITSEAYRKSQGISGAADAEAIAIYANAYNNDPGFYAFMKTLESYPSTIDSDTTIVLTTDADYFKYLKKQE